jgi:hypothetical protein
MPGRLSKSSRPTQATASVARSSPHRHRHRLARSGRAGDDGERAPSGAAAISPVIRGRRTAHSGTLGTVILTSGSGRRPAPLTAWCGTAHDWQH